jgi:FtsK/SpoIIIE family
MAGEPGPDGRKRAEHAAEAITLAAVAGLAAEALLPGSGAPSWVLPATEIIAGWGGALVTWSGGKGWFLPGYLAAFGSLLGGWTILAQQAGLWTGTALGSWLAGMSVLAPVGLAAALRRRERVPEPRAEIVMAAIEPDPVAIEMRKFEHLLAEVLPELKEDPIRVLSLEEGAAGRVLRLQLPRSGGATVTTLRDKARVIEVMLQAQEGAVGFELGDHSGDVIMRVRERDGLAEIALLTPDLRARTVNEPLVMGRQEDGSWLKMLFREMHALVVGTTGSGKSNWINVLIAQLASCNDTIIWMIDMKQGRAAKPWFQAWEDGRAASPPIDWVATTREEAWLMMEAVLAAAQTRSASGIGGNKIIPTPSLPQVCLIVDETAILFGSERGTRTEVGEGGHTNTQFIAKEDEVLQVGRSEAIAGVFATQRGTNSMAGSGDSKANLTTRVALKPATLAELQYVVPDAHFAAKQMAYLCNTPGVGIVAQGSHVSGITKFLHHDHIEGECGKDHARPHCAPGCPVYQTALDTGPIRPALDMMTAIALGEPYANRWRRAAETGVVRVPLAVLSGGRAVPVSIDAFDEIISDVRDPEKELHPDRIRYRQFLAGRGAMGATPKMIWEHLEEQAIADSRPAKEDETHTVTRECLQRWMREDEGDGIVHNPDMGRWKFGPGARRSAA